MGNGCKQFRQSTLVPMPKSPRNRIYSREGYNLRIYLTSISAIFNLNTFIPKGNHV